MQSILLALVVVLAAACTLATRTIAAFSPHHNCYRQQQQQQQQQRRACWRTNGQNCGHGMDRSSALVSSSVIRSASRGNSRLHVSTSTSSRATTRTTMRTANYSTSTSGSTQTTQTVSFNETAASQQHQELQAELEKLLVAQQEDQQQQQQPLQDRQFPHLVQQDSVTTTIATPTATTVSSTTAIDKDGIKDEGIIWQARLLLLGAAALYGTNFSLIKLLGDTGMPVGISATLRFGLASLATLPWLLQAPSGTSTSSTVSNTESPQSTSWQSRLQQWVNSLNSSTAFGAAVAGFEVGMWNSVGYLAQAVGLETTDASKSAFICSLAVVIVPMIDFLSGKRLLPREIGGAIMAVAGVGVLEFGSALASSSNALALSSGDWASLLQPLMFGVAFWRMEGAMRKYPNEANRSTAAQLLAVFVTSAAYCLSTCTIDWSQVQLWLHDGTLLASLAFTGIITTALTIYMEAVALKTLTAAETTLILSTEPLWGAGFAAVLIGEQFGMDAAIGATLIIAGCIYSNLGMDGIKKMLPALGRQPTTEPVESVVTEQSAKGEDEAEEEGVDTPTGALLQVGLIGLFARLIAMLEADILLGGAASVVAAEEIVEEVTKDLL